MSQWKPSVSQLRSHLITSQIWRSCSVVWKQGPVAPRKSGTARFQDAVFRGLGDFWSTTRCSRRPADRKAGVRSPQRRRSWSAECSWALPWLFLRPSLQEREHLHTQRNKTELHSSNTTVHCEQEKYKKLCFIITLANVNRFTNKVTTRFLRNRATLPRENWRFERSGVLEKLHSKLLLRSNF